jgi:heme-degrading monooxygenase HmoA
MHARTGTLQVSADQIDAMVEQLKSNQLPQYRDTDGYKGFTVLADRGSGKVIGISFWESQEALQASEELGVAARAEAAETGQAGAEPVAERWEVVLDDTA